MMFENLEELLKNTECLVKSAHGERSLYWIKVNEEWLVLERKRYGKKTKALYEGEDLREAMQYLK